MKIIFLLIFSSSLYALVYGDKMSGKILKAYDQNYLVINRGVEDGIFKGEHVKISNSQGYVSRAICIKPRMMISHCKVYRVVNPELLSLDSRYTISSIKQSEIPKDLNFLKDINYKDRFNDFTDKDVNKALSVQNERIANFDLVNDFKEEPLAPRDTATRSQSILDKNFDKKLLDKDLKTLKVQLFASPLSFQSQGGSYSQDYGVALMNNGKKYDFVVGYKARKNKIANQYLDTNITQETTQLYGEFELKDFSKNFSSISFLDIKSQEFDGIKTPMNSNKFGLIGLKYYFEKSDSFKSSFSYIPFFEKTVLDSTLKNKEIDENMLRHRLVYSSQKSFSDRFKVNFGIDFQPELTFKEITTYIDLGLDFKMTKKLSFSYDLGFVSNSLIQDNYDLENSNLINTINLNYQFTL